MDILTVVLEINEHIDVYQCLQPFIDANLINFLILGKEFKMNNNNFIDLNIKIVDDCSINNYSNAIKIHFPETSFALILDMEQKWTIIGVIKLLDFCSNNESSLSGYFNICDKPILINMKNENNICGGNIPTTFQGKIDIYKDLLNKYNNDKNPQTAFQLGELYNSRKDNNNAIKFYKERFKYPDQSDEFFLSGYKLGLIYENLNDWDNALLCYTKTYEYCPNRAEPLIRCAMHYMDGKIKYMYANQACKISYPNDKISKESFFDYNYTRWDQLAIGAWYMGEYKQMFDALKYALDINMFKPHLKRNLELCLGALGLPQKPKMINLIYYDESLFLMYNILLSHLKQSNIDFYFYTYDKNLENKTDIIYIEDDLFSKFSSHEYDYIILSNISTIINYDVLNFWLSYNNIDYASPYNIILDNMKNINESCLILSKKAINNKFKEDIKKGDMCERHMKINSFDFELGIIAYRNEHSDKMENIKNMGHMCYQITQNKQ